MKAAQLFMGRLYSPWDSLDKNTGVSSHSLLQGIFPTQGLNWSPLPCRRILYQMSYQGSPIWLMSWWKYGNFYRQAWTSVMWRDTGRRWPFETQGQRPKTNASYPVLRRNWPCWHPDIGLLASKLWDNKCCFLGHRVHSSLLQ